MRRIAIEELTEEAFAPFGDVLAPSPVHGRRSFDGALATTRPAATPRLALATVETAASLPLESRTMERHIHSSQSFLPLGPQAFLVVVAPHAPVGGPDMARARAFVATGGVGVTYGADVWHHPLTALETPARLAVWMWRDGGLEDEEFVDVEPFVITR